MANRLQPLSSDSWSDWLRRLSTFKQLPLHSFAADASHSIYSSYWNLIRRVASTNDLPFSLPFSSPLLFAAVLDIATRSQRPGPLVDHLRQLSSAIHRLSDGAFPSIFFSSSSFNLAVTGIIRDATKRDRRRLALVDIPRLLHHLRNLPAPSSSSELRDVTLAAVAATIPGRRSEWSRLLLSHATVVIHPNIHSTAAPRRVALSDPSIPPTSQLVNCDFEIEIVVSSSKADQIERKGFIKKLFHAAGESWSPAVALLLLSSRTRAAASAASTPLAEAPLFPVFTPSFRPMATATPSLVLRRVSRRFTGVAASAHAFRASAASHLLQIGMPIQLVTALGGWASDEAIRRHYALHVRPDSTIIRRLAGNLPSLPSSSTRRPPSPVPPLSPLRRLSQTPPSSSSPVFESPHYVTPSPSPSPPLRRPASSIRSIFKQYA